MPPPYLPDDAHITLPALDFLRTPQGVLLRQSIADLPAPAHPTVAQIAALRKRFPAEPLHAALTLAALQPKATAKFPQIPFVWATPEALEQATHTLVAQHKAQQFARVNPTRIFDLCAGIGGDTFALADIAPITAVDLSPVRTACLHFNLADHTPQPRFPLDIRTGDIRNLLDTLPPDAWIHIDPARRSAGHRSPRYEDLIPGPDVLEKLFARAHAGGGGSGGGVIKLSPAVDFESLPPGHLELISHRGTVVQALLWIGPFPFPPDTRTATLLADTLPGWSFQAPPHPVAVHPLPFLSDPLPPHPIYFYELDGALTRASLAHAFAQQTHLTHLTIDGGYLVAQPGAPLLAHPAVTAFQIQSIVPFSISRVAQALQLLPPTAPGPIEVKSRGRLPGIDTDHLQKTWSKACPSVHTVLLFRHENYTRAAIANRVTSAANIAEGDTPPSRGQASPARRVGRAPPPDNRPESPSTL